MYWNVTTRSDDYGSSNRHLGIYEGDVPTIALYLADQAISELTFTPLKTDDIGVPTAERIRVCVPKGTDMPSKRMYGITKIDTTTDTITYLVVLGAELTKNLHLQNVINKLTPYELRLLEEMFTGEVEEPSNDRF